MTESPIYTNSYITRKFGEIWVDEPTFTAEMFKLMTDAYDTTLTEAQCKRLFYELSARFTGSNVRYTDEFQFKLRLGSIMSQYGPLYFSNLELVAQAQGTELDQFMTAGKTLMNAAQNNATLPGVGTDQELPYVNSQNVVNTKRAIDIALDAKKSFLRDEFTKQFYTRFNELFISIIYPQMPMWFITEEEV